MVIWQVIVYQILFADSGLPPEGKSSRAVSEVTLNADLSDTLMKFSLLGVIKEN